MGPNEVKCGQIGPNRIKQDQTFEADLALFLNFAKRHAFKQTWCNHVFKQRVMSTNILRIYSQIWFKHIFKYAVNMGVNLV